MAGTIAIVGAGIAGLCTAKTLAALGFEVTVFEKEPDLGGVWSSSRRYPGLTTQNPRETYAFSDWPMPDDYGRRARRCRPIWRAMPIISE